MKSPFIFLYSFLLLSIPLFGQQFNYTLALDFSADQAGAPFPGHAAAYLINTGKDTLTFKAGLHPFKYSWMGQINLFSNKHSRNRSDEIMEVILDESVYGENFKNEVFLLEPGKRVKVFSAAFTEENRKQYPYSELTGYVDVNREEKRIIAYFSK